MLAPHCHNGCCRYDWIAKRGKIVHSCPLDPLWGSVVHAPDSYLSPVEKLQILHSKNCDSKHTSTFIPLVYCKIQFSSKVLFSQGVILKACIFRLEYVHSRNCNMSERFRFYKDYTSVDALTLCFSEKLPAAGILAFIFRGQ